MSAPRPIKVEPPLSLMSQFPIAQPTTNGGGTQNGSSVGRCTTLHTRYLHVLSPTCHAQSVLGDKISASELRRKFTTKCVVGWVVQWIHSLSKTWYRPSWCISKKTNKHGLHQVTSSWCKEKQTCFTPSNIKLV